MRCVFAGTPQVAVLALERLLASRHEILAVLTRPDAAAGRGRRVEASPVAQRARAEGIPVLAPATARDPALAEQIAALAPDCCPVVAYGGLIPAPLLGVPARGWINLHFSLLPAWRGAAPVQWALLTGDEITGASTFVLEEGLDTGPVLGTVAERIRPRDTAGELLGRLAAAGAELLAATLDALEDGTASPRAQERDGVSFAPKLGTQDARVRWTEPAVGIDRRIRACTPAPGAWTTFRGERLRLGPVLPVGGADPRRAPGEISLAGAEVEVGTATGPVRLGEVQAAGRRAMAAADWARGQRLAPGEAFA